MRYKEFNPNRVLEKCIPLFWRSGFRACSISEIVEETGVNRYSLYEEFENKEGILYASMQLYKERYCINNLKILEKEGSVEELIREFHLSYFIREKFQEGCYIIHLGTELADNDQQVRDLLRTYLAEIEEQFRMLLKRDEATWERKDFFARNLIGHFITSMSFGLIHDMNARIKHIENGINVILNKQITHA